MLPSGYAEWVHMEESDIGVAGSMGGPSDEINVDELCCDNSRAPLASLRGTTLGWSTVIGSLNGTETQAVTLTKMSLGRPVSP